MQPLVPQQVRMRYELVVVGGGLQAALLVLSVLAHRPDASIAVVERGQRLGGDHIWSFHAEDLPEGARAHLEPLVVRRWPSYDVAFPGLRRTLQGPYASTTSARVHEVVTEALARNGACACVLGAEVREVESARVVLADGRAIDADLVVDARGPVVAQDPSAQVAFQKFVGLELELTRPLERDTPLLIDACVPQTDGFRFFYVLPFAPRRVLVEETYFSDSSALDVDALRDSVLRYAEAIGADVQSIARQEVGVLPLPLVHHRHGVASRSPLVAGYRGGWFHPTTGYSFGASARLALTLAQHHGEGAHGPALRDLVERHARQSRYFVMLNRLLFRAMPAEERWRVLCRFHRLPEPLIRRFYAMQTTSLDRARILCGRPPAGISLGRAISELAAS